MATGVKNAIDLLQVATNSLLQNDIVGLWAAIVIAIIIIVFIIKSMLNRGD